MAQKIDMQTEAQLIPENGSVVVIDDQPTEALPIVKALSKKGIATTYYQGNIKEDLPEAPVQNVRLLFLDLQIIETNDEHQIAKSIINVLLKVISEKNGPYLLVIWSKKFNTYSEAVKNEIYKHDHLIPACIVNFDKASCLESKQIPSIEANVFIDKLNDLLEGQIHADDIETVMSAVTGALKEEYTTEYEAKPDAIEIIERQLKTELEKAGAFHLFVIWENLVRKAAARMVYEVSSLIDNNEHWEINAKNVLKRMGVARIGQNQVTEDVLIQEAINTLNISLVDNVEHEMKGIKMPKHISLQNDVVYINKVGTDNFSLKLSSTESEILKNDISVKKAVDQAKLRKGFNADTKMNADDKKSALQVLENYHLLPPSLNTKLHIELYPSQELIPGNIYLNPEEKKKEQYIGSFLKKMSGKVEEYFLIDLEVSPICDYAQQKWKRSRTLPGLMYPKKYEDDARGGAHIYPVAPSFNIDGLEYKLIFDYHLFNASDKANAKKREVRYRLKRELLLDIIAQLSSHVNRPGISFIE